MASISIRNQLVSSDEKLEAEYMETVKRYTPEEVAAFVEMMGITSEAAQGDGDFLGSAFMRNELSSHWHGQFFTPWSLALLMAEMTLDASHVSALIEEKGFVSLLEPACGAGVTVLAAANVIRRQGHDPSRAMRVEAVDVDRTAALMSYVQFSANGIPALVRVGNSLSMEMREAWPTPALARCA